MNKIKAAVVLLFSIIPVQQTFCGEEISFLMEGPVESKGIPYIYPNAITTYTGYYRYGDIKVTAMFTDEVFVIPEEWKPDSCGGYSGLSFTDVTGEDGNASVFCYLAEDADGGYMWSVFLRFSPEPDCSFIRRFLKRFIYLQKDWKPGFPPLMPAVIE